MDRTAVYIHWPFCKSKCPYCDFNSHVRDNINQDTWQKAYIKEINYYREILSSKQISSIFFGGGTPSLAEPYVIASIIDHLAGITKFASDIEITLEANPTSVESSKFNALKLAGINRLSLGIQSLDPTDLKFLGREHSVADALLAIDVAANIFEQYSFDLIYALPEQKLKAWESELLRALKYVRNHISLYQLTIEKGTQLFASYKSGKFKMLDENIAADFYELTQSIMSQQNMPAYEISNHAIAGLECKHNVNYWNYGDYIGIGPGAHGRYTYEGKKYATVMVYSPEKWLEKLELVQPGSLSISILSDSEIQQESIMMGLRLSKGINKSLLYSCDKLIQKIKELISDGLLEENITHVKTTQKGKLVLNSIISELTVNY